MQYYLSLGSNIGAREQTLRTAIQLIEQQIGPVPRCSSFYYSAPWGYASAHEYCNMCCVVESALPPMEVLHATQTIERQLGRTHKTIDGKYSDRTIDIDIIEAYDGPNEIQIHTPELQLPHPLWTQRDFVRIPLEEIKEKER